MKTLDLMIDLDDVVFPMIDNVHRLAHEAGLHDNSRPLATWRGWEQYGCTEATFFDLWGTFARADGYVLTPPIPGAVEAMRKYASAGHRMHLVTARGFMAYAAEVRDWTREWVTRYDVPHASLTFSKNKPEVQAQLGVRFDAAFDDSPPNAYALARDGVRTFLVDHPHNAWVEDLPRVPDLATGLSRVLDRWESVHGSVHVVRDTEHAIDRRPGDVVFTVGGATSEGGASGVVCIVQAEDLARDPHLYRRSLDSIVRTLDRHHTIR